MLHDVTGGSAHAADSGIYCDGCGLTALACAVPVFVCGAPRCLRDIGELTPPAIPSSTPALHRSPRGPPRVA